MLVEPSPLCSLYYYHYEYLGAGSGRAEAFCFSKNQRSDLQMQIDKEVVEELAQKLYKDAEGFLFRKAFLYSEPPLTDFAFVPWDELGQKDKRAFRQAAQKFLASYSCRQNSRTGFRFHSQNSMHNPEA